MNVFVGGSAGVGLFLTNDASVGFSHPARLEFLSQFLLMQTRDSSLFCSYCIEHDWGWFGAVIQFPSSRFSAALSGSEWLSAALSGSEWF